MKTTIEFLPDSSQWASVQRGPFVMAAVTDSTDMNDLWADESRMAHVASDEMYPIDQAPKLIATNAESLLGQLKTNEKGNLVYTGEVHPAGYKNIELVPFYKVHGARYMIYWPVMDRESLDRTLEDIRKKEKALRELKARTIDQVATGEQQPEAEHNFQGSASRSGNNGGKFWRDALDWFSYDLKQGPVEEKVLRIQYFSGDAGRKFNIMVNGHLLETVELKPGKTPFYTVDYRIPASLLNGSGVLKLRFEADKGSVAGGIYHIRLMGK
jgi:hypothetical protein